ASLGKATCSTTSLPFRALTNGRDSTGLPVLFDAAKKWVDCGPRKRNWPSTPSSWLSVNRYPAVKRPPENGPVLALWSLNRTVVSGEPNTPKVEVGPVVTSGGRGWPRVHHSRYSAPR